MKSLIQRKSLAIMILTISLFSMMNSFVGATSYNKTYYNVVYTASSSVDDAYYLIGYEFSNNSTLGYLQSSSYDTYTGFRFTNINIPTTAIIDSAYISLYSGDSINNNYYPTTIRGINNINSTGFNTFADLYSITLLSHYVNWDMKDLEGGAWANSSDVKTLLIDIMGNAGWVTNNSISFRFGSAKTTIGTRSFTTYDYDSHQYAPKIYITYHTLTPITEDNPPNSIVDNYDYDVIELVDNDTVTGYLTWKLYSGVSIDSYTVYDNTNHYYKFYNGTHWNNIAYSSALADYESRKIVDDYNKTLYSFLPIKDNGYYDLWLYKSINRGITWSQLIKVSDNAYSSVSTSIDIAESIGVIYLCYLRSGYIEYRTYNIGTSTLSNAISLGGNLHTSIQMLVSSKANWRIVVTANTEYVRYWVNATSMWSSIGIVSPLTGHVTYSAACDLIESSGETVHAIFALAYNFPYVGIAGLYMDSDYSVSRMNLMYESDNVLSVKFGGASDYIIVEGVSYTGVYSSPHIVKRERIGEKNQISSVVHILLGNPFVGNIFYDPLSAQSILTYIIESNGASYYTASSYNETLPAGTIIENSFSQRCGYMQRLVVGTAISYVITDENGDIIWEGTTLPVVDDLPITATSVRNFLFIMGLILMIVPPICWSVGGEYRSIMGIGIGLISMLTGLAFLMSITSIML